MARIVSQDQLADIVSERKAEGQSIVLANGAFDLLHVGHVRYLQGAAREADCLVVALNSDTSVRTLKGEGRPVTPLAERMEMIAAVECVDFVTSFEETKVSNLLLLLKPDVHAKGTDYTADTVPEVDTVKTYGGRVAIVGDPKDHNTSDLVAQIKNGKDET